MTHFCMDIETVGKTTDSIILSAAIVHFELTEKVTYDELLSRSLLVKFDVKEQRSMGRKLMKSTLEWWAKQPKESQRASLVPSSKDVTVLEGLTIFDEYVNNHGGKDSMCWVRGSLDQLLLDSLYEIYNRKPSINYNRYMDIRTAFRLMKESTDSTGYVDIPNFDKTKVIKHHPVHDICYDVMMLLYGD